MPLAVGAAQILAAEVLSGQILVAQIFSGLGERGW
jgi:hypothetical protein